MLQEWHLARGSVMGCLKMQDFLHSASDKGSSSLSVLTAQGQLIALCSLGVQLSQSQSLRPYISADRVLRKLLHCKAHTHSSSLQTRQDQVHLQPVARERRQSLQGDASTCYSKL